MRGYFGIGIENGKTKQNLGTLWRSAYLFGADFVFTIGKRYKKQASDTTKAIRHIPLYNYVDFEDFYKHLPCDCRLVGIELMENSIDLKNYKHLERCIYLLGAEDHGLTKQAIEKCDKIVKLSYPNEISSLNVATTGSIVMWHRSTQFVR